MAAPTLPSTMKAWQYNSTPGGVEKNMKLNPTATVPHAAKPDQHVVRILSTALNRVDYKPADVGFIDRWIIKHPATPCVDYVGRIVTPAAGSVLKPGQMVYGVSGTNPMAGGALAEYNIASKSGTAVLPEGVDPQQAGTLGIAAMTAYGSIVNVAAPNPGGRVFLNGGSGGVGMFGIQIAKASGFHVTTTCSSRNVEFCKNLGADVVIDYTAGPVIEQLQKATKEHKIDLVVDNVGGEISQELYWKMHTYTNPKAVFIEVAGEPTWSFLWYQLKAAFIPGFLGGGKRKMKNFYATPSEVMWERFGKWMQEGKLKSTIDTKFAFEDAPKAFERSKTQRAVGKIVVDVGLDAEKKA